MTKINYIKGDATAPIGDDTKILVHVCNDIGGWGKGFVLAISKRWKTPEVSYREWYRTGEDFELGNVQYVQVEDDLWIANLIGQHKIRKSLLGTPPIRYEAIRSGLADVRRQSIELNASIHMPRIGCGLAGGKWENIEEIISEELLAFDRMVTVYDFG